MSSLHVCTCKGKDKKLVDNQWKENAQRAYEKGIKQINMIDMASMACEKANTNKRANKQESTEKVVSARDKCRFRPNVHNFIVLKHGQHTSKQNSCMDM